MSGRLRKLTLDQAAQAVAIYESGLSVGDVALRFGVTRQAMWDLLRRRTQLRPQQRRGAANHFHRGGVRADDHTHNLVEEATERGVLVRPLFCESCGGSGRMRDGRTTIQAHHDDYNRPLDVRWLCQRCHHAWHRVNVAVQRTTSPDEACR